MPNGIEFSFLSYSSTAQMLDAEDDGYTSGMTCMWRKQYCSSQLGENASAASLQQQQYMLHTCRQMQHKEHSYQDVARLA